MNTTRKLIIALFVVCFFTLNAVFYSIGKKEGLEQCEEQAIVKLIEKMEENYE